MKSQEPENKDANPATGTESDQPIPGAPQPKEGESPEGRQ